MLEVPVCVNAAEHIHTHTRLAACTPLEPVDRCTDTPERTPHLQPDAGSACGASLRDSEKGMRVVPSHKPSLEVSGKMKV